MNICLFRQDEMGKALPLGDERAKHIVKVLKKGAGDTFDAGIIGGKAGVATITGIGDGGMSFSFEPFSDEERAEGKMLRPLTLIVGFPRPIQLRRLLRDVAGLGAERIILSGTELGEKSYMESNDIKDGAALRMLLDGTVQAASTHVPELVVAKSLREAVSISGCGSSANVALDNRRATKSLGAWLFDESEKGALSRVCVAIGSERGWTERERDFLESASFSLCSMGNRVLRTETAVTVASSIILDRMGFLN